MPIDRLKKLKHLIDTKHIPNDLKIFVCPSNNFTAYQYANAIADTQSYDIEYITSLECLNHDNIFASLADTNIYVCKIDKLTPPIAKPSLLSNVIVICDKVDEALLTNYEPYIIEFPPLQNWQIEEFVQARLPSLNNMHVKWLCEKCKYNIYRINIEIARLACFSDCASAFCMFKDDSTYDDLATGSIFELVNAITKKDKNAIIDILTILNNIDVEPYGLLTILLKQIKSLIAVQTDNKTAIAELNLSSKQVYAIKFNCGTYATDELITIYGMLSNIDYQLKSGLLDYAMIIDYILIHILK